MSITFLFFWRTFLKILFSAIFALATAFSASAATVETAVPAVVNSAPVTANAVGQVPTSLAGVKIITAEEVKKFTALKEVMIFDTRENLQGGIIQNAFLVTFSVPPPSARKYSKVVFYSQGINDWSAYKAAEAAVKAGYKQVYLFHGGVDEWLKKGFTLETVIVKQ